MRGLFEKTWRETFWGTVAFAIGFGAAEGLLAYAIPTVILPYAEEFLKMEFLQPFLVGLLGERVEGAFEKNNVIALAWVDPVVYAIVWAHAIWFCSRVPAGEIDRGTMDVLLGLPVSRFRLYLAETVGLVVGGLFVVVFGLFGNWIATWLLDGGFEGVARMTIRMATNLYFMNLAVAGVVFAASAISDRRGGAVGLSLFVVITSFLISFLSQLWWPFQHVRWLSVLRYYKPLEIVRFDAWPVSDMVTLGLVGAAFWGAGAIVFIRRDIRT